MGERQKVPLDQLEEDDEFEEFDQVSHHHHPDQGCGSGFT
jgi:hypothetical protein